MFSKWSNTDKLASWNKMIETLTIAELNNVASDILHWLINYLATECSNSAE